MTADLKYSARVLRRSPGLTILSVVTMGLGIGAAAILFALVNAIVLRPLPYPESDRLVRIFDTNREAGIDRSGVASGNIDDWRRRSGAFAGIAGYYAMGRTVSTDGDAEVLITAQVSEDFFDLFRTAPVLGRVFTAAETGRAMFNSAAAPVGSDPVVVLSHRVWMQRFGGRRDALGRTLMLERRPFTVVGVMPPGFAMPDAGVDLWIPWNITTDAPRDQHYLGAVGRLQPGVPLGEAEDRLNAVARSLADEHPATNRGWGVSLVPLAEDVAGGASSVLWVLLAAVGLVLLVVCANVSLLSLLRGLDRREESAVRLALGASPSRLMREHLLEAVLLSLAGGVLGAAATVAGLRVLPAVTTDLPRLGELALDGGVWTAVAAVTLCSGILSGLPQAWSRTRMASLAALTGARGRATAGGGRHWLRDGIVVSQVALAVLLVLGAGLLVRSFVRLRQIDSGFDPRGVLVAPVFLDTQAYNTGAKTRAYYRALFDRLSAIPGVVVVGGATTVPTSPLGPDFERPVWPDGADSHGPQRTPAAVRMVTPGYFRAMSLRVIDGRAIDESDAPESPRVIMVSERLARRLWPGQSAIGRRLVVDYSTAGTYPYEIIGVVADVRFRGPRSEPLAEIYLPHAQRSYLILNVVIKAAGDPRALAPFVREALKAVDPQKPAQGLYALEDLVAATYVRDRQAMTTLIVFGAVAVFLAVLSIYGVLAQRVRERAREIGIRMAIGADTTAVVGWLVRSGLRLVAFGIALGIVTARLLGGALDRVLFGVAATDPATTAAVIAVLTLVGGLATLVPSWSATRIDPVTVLRRG